MFAKVGSLGEGHMADFALVGTLVCVDAKVIKEVVPLAEVL